MPTRPDPAVVAVISAGGGVGSVLRYALSELYPVSGHGMPWVTLGINVVGSFLLAALIVAVTEIWRPHHLVRPLFGTGVLGGFTTFSTFAVQARSLSLPTSLLYVLLSVGGAILAAVAGMAVVRRIEPRVQIAATHEYVDPIDPDLP